MENWCENCRFWNDTSDDENDRGQCRRRPPIVNDVVLRELSEPEGSAYDEIKFPIAWHWPITCSDDWCGEFQRDFDKIDIGDGSDSDRS